MEISPFSWRGDGQKLVISEIIYRIDWNFDMQFNYYER